MLWKLETSHIFFMPIVLNRSLEKIVNFVNLHMPDKAKKLEFDLDDYEGDHYSFIVK